MDDRTEKHLQRDALRIHRHADRGAAGAAAAAEVARRLKSLAERQEELRTIFAAAPSQNEFLDALVETPGVPWDRIVAFHLDEYLGLPPRSARRFGHFLRERLFDRVPFRRVHYLDGSATDPEAECRRYSALLTEAPLDVACLGIGENGHLAFNDPPVADFADPEVVKMVELDEVCRNQQVHDGCFPDIGAVPTHAFTVTIPVLMAARHCSVVVPGAAKADAVRAMIEGPIDEQCPASVLRRHPDADLYVDPAAAAHLSPELLHA
ncbi:MAG TPA: glucosamine-6-phosphate deaminase [Rhodothermales bacterium]